MPVKISSKMSNRIHKLVCYISDTHSKLKDLQEVKNKLNRQSILLSVIISLIVLSPLRLCFVVEACWVPSFDLQRDLVLLLVEVWKFLRLLLRSWRNLVHLTENFEVNSCITGQLSVTRMVDLLLNLERPRPLRF